MKLKKITRRNVLNDALVLFVVIVVALIVIFKDRSSEASPESLQENGATTEQVAE